MSQNHRRLIHVPSEVDVTYLKPNLKLYSEEFIARIKHAFKDAADGCYTLLQDQLGTVVLTHPLFVFQGKCFASYLEQDDEVGCVQDLESGEWLKRHKISVHNKKEGKAVTHDEFDRIVKHGDAIGELVKHGNQHVQFFTAREQKAKSVQRPTNVLMMRPGMMIAQESQMKKVVSKPEGDFVLFSKIIPGMTIAQFMVKRQSWPAALKLNMSMMMVSLVADMQSASREHVNLNVETVIFNLQKKLDKMIRLQGFGMCAAADEAVKRLQVGAGQLATPEVLANNVVLGRFLQSLWRGTELPQPMREGVYDLIARLIEKQPVDLAKEVNMLSEFKLKQLLPLNETLIPMYLLKVSECRELMQQGDNVFNAFCQSLAANYFGVRLFDCLDDEYEPEMIDLLKMKQVLERANLIVSDKYFFGTSREVQQFIESKNKRAAVNGMRFVFSTAESLMAEHDFALSEEHGSNRPADVRLELGEVVVQANAAEMAGDFDNDADDEEENDSEDVFDAMLDAASSMTARIAKCCLRVFRPNRDAQHSLDAATEGPIQLHTDTGWEGVKRLV